MRRQPWRDPPKLSGSFVDSSGSLVESAGSLVDSVGSLVDSPGSFVGTCRRKCDIPGQMSQNTRYHECLCRIPRDIRPADVA